MQVVIVTGLSGAGKSQAMACLEDQGYYCIDNMPPALIGNFMSLSSTSKDSINKVAFAVDIRGGEFFNGLLDAMDELERREADVRVVFLEASDDVLIHRYSETRRVYPKSRKPVTRQDIERERNLLAGIRDKADFVIDTSGMKNAQLKQTLLELMVDNYQEETFVITLMSFGYKHGIPVNADIVFDMRFLPNPYYVPTLKKLTGNNKKIHDYLFKFDITNAFVRNAERMLASMITGYMHEGKWHLTIAFGCTGGHHRSVAMANEFCKRFQQQGWQVTIEHRDITK